MRRGEKTRRALIHTGENHPGNTTITEDDVTIMDATQPLATQVATQEADDQDKDAFELAQLLFVVGHVAVKHIVFLELVEREWKRQKDRSRQVCSFPCRYLPHAVPENGKEKENDELDQVVGNAEDEIGDRIAPQFAKRCYSTARLRCWQFMVL